MERRVARGDLPPSWEEQPENMQTIKLKDTTRPDSQDCSSTIGDGLLEDSSMPRSGGRTHWQFRRFLPSTFCLHCLPIE